MNCVAVFRRASAVAADTQTDTANHVPDTGGRSRSVATDYGNGIPVGLSRAPAPVGTECVNADDFSTTAAPTISLAHLSVCTGCACLSASNIKSPCWGIKSSKGLRLVIWLHSFVCPTYRVISGLLALPFKLSALGSRTFNISDAQTWGCNIITNFVCFSLSTKNTIVSSILSHCYLA